MQIGWNMTIETTNGIVVLWTSWLGKGFKLFYPLDANIPDEVLMETLNVTLAKPVADERMGTRLWAKYYSEKLDDCGRVWIDQEPGRCDSIPILTIRNKRVEENYCGARFTNAVWTYDLNCCSETSPEAPNCREKNIQAYKDKFVQLLVKIAKLVGDITAVNLDSGLVLYTPEMLKEKGYDLKRWVDEDEDIEYYYTQDDNCEIILESGNSLVSWSTVIRYPSTNELTAESLLKLLDSFDNSKNALNPIPLIANHCAQERIYKD